MMPQRDEHPHELISALLDGEIDTHDRSRVESHLRECAPCRDLAGDLRVLDAALGAEPVPPVPRELASRIGWRLGSARAQHDTSLQPSRRGAAGALPRRWPRMRAPRTFAAAGTVAAAAILTLVLLRREGPDVPRIVPETSETEISSPRDAVGAAEGRERAGVGATDQGSAQGAGDGGSTGGIVADGLVGGRPGGNEIARQARSKEDAARTFQDRQAGGQSLAAPAQGTKRGPFRLDFEDKLSERKAEARRGRGSRAKPVPQDTRFAPAPPETHSVSGTSDAPSPAGPPRANTAQLQAEAPPGDAGMFRSSLESSSAEQKKASRPNVPPKTVVGDLEVLPRAPATSTAQGVPPRPREESGAALEGRTKSARAGPDRAKAPRPVAKVGASRPEDDSERAPEGAGEPARAGISGQGQDEENDLPAPTGGATAGGTEGYSKDLDALKKIRDEKQVEPALSGARFAGAPTAVIIVSGYVFEAASGDGSRWPAIIRAKDPSTIRREIATRTGLAEGRIRLRGGTILTGSGRAGFREGGFTTGQDGIAVRAEAEVDRSAPGSVGLRVCTFVAGASPVPAADVRLAADEETLLIPATLGGRATVVALQAALVPSETFAARSREIAAEFWKSLEPRLRGPGLELKASSTAGCP